MLKIILETRVQRYRAFGAMYTRPCTRLFEESCTEDGIFMKKKRRKIICSQCTRKKEHVPI